jgi:NADPH:quinone reductase-like Zn-dependent oxidoreductase
LDLDRDFALGLKPFTRCLSFHAIDLDRMLAQRPDLCAQIFTSIHERLVQGRLRPLPVSVYPHTQAAQAFQDMAAATHTGKLVIDVTGQRVPVGHAN